VTAKIYSFAAKPGLKMAHSFVEVSSFNLVSAPKLEFEGPANSVWVTGVAAAKPRCSRASSIHIKKPFNCAGEPIFMQLGGPFGWSCSGASGATPQRLMIVPFGPRDWIVT
jgi:hypothetical protein